MSLLSGLQSMFFGPAGTFARSRRDCMVKAQMMQFQAGGGLATDITDTFLYNNDNLGRYIALYGLFVQNVNAHGFDLLVVPNPPALALAGVSGFPTMFDQQIGPGLINSGNNVGPNFTTDTFFPFGADGFQLVLDTPIILIPPKQSIDVQTFNQAKGSTVTMVWAPF